MTIPPLALVIILLIFGFLSGSTAYFYNKSRTVSDEAKGKNITEFNGQIVSDKKTDTGALDTLTQPAEPRGRLSYPAHAYTVQPKDTLFAIGAKLSLPWQLITQANGITNENIVQAGFTLAIPKLSEKTDYYRINLIINEDKARELNTELRNADKSEYFNPVEVAKKSATPYFGLKAEDSFNLLNQDLSQGTAVVEVKKVDYSAIIGLSQPKVTGEKGIWAVIYVEKQDK